MRIIRTGGEKRRRCPRPSSTELSLFFRTAHLSGGVVARKGRTGWATALVLLWFCLAAAVAAQGSERNNLYGAAVEARAASDDLATLEFCIHAKSLIQQERFAELDQIADEARLQKTRFVGGQWKLAVLYRVLAAPGSAAFLTSDSTWEAHIAHINRWVVARPESITARLVLADVYVLFAWRARGDGYGDTVTKEGKKLFKDRIALAKTVLDDAAKLPAKCPHYYETMQSVALAQGWSRERAEKLLQEARAFEPGYYYYYINHLSYLKPVWYGAPGDGAAFVNEIADSLGGALGDFVYYAMAARFGNLNLGVTSGGLPVPTLSWDRVKRGFTAAEQLYGISKSQLNVMAYMAMQVNDRKEAQTLFQRIGDDYDQNVWGSVASFEKAKSLLRRQTQMAAVQETANGNCRRRAGCTGMEAPGKPAKSAGHPAEMQPEDLR